MDVFLNSEYVVNTGDVPVIMVPVTQLKNHLVAQGLFAASYANFGEVKIDSADQNHYYMLIDPSVTNQIQIRKINRAQWIALSK